jgi:hypothetical protein
MAFTQDDFQAYLTACNTAIGSGDFAGARTAAVQAQVILSGMPDYADGDRSIKNKELISSVMEQLDVLEQKSTAARSNSRVYVSYRRT